MKIQLHRDGQSPSKAHADSYDAALECAWAFAKYTGAGVVKVYEEVDDTLEPLGVVARWFAEDEAGMELDGARS